MGTSTNQRSPKNVPSWRIFQQMLGLSDAPIEQQTTELWRAAAADKEGKFVSEISSEPVAIAFTLASGESSAIVAATKFDDVLDSRQESGIVFDLAKRALLRSVNNKLGAEGFAQELFVEAANYYVSRDLPSYVAAKGRIETTSAALTLKQEIRNQTRQVVIPISKNLTETATRTGRVEHIAWRDFISTTLANLQKRRPR